MPRSLPKEIHSHWGTLVEGLQASPMEFYRSVEEAIDRRQIPDTSRSRVQWQEGGALSAKREYLRVNRGALNFDIGAAPFGTGFFFSWWLIGPTHGLKYLVLLLIAIVIVISATLKLFGLSLGLLLGLVLVPATLLLLGDAVRKGRLGREESVLAIPLVGRLYEWIFSPNTYYKLDTESMFQTAVHGAVMEAIDGITTTKGVRPLTELERKPVYDKLAELTPRSARV